MQRIMPEGRLAMGCGRLGFRARIAGRAGSAGVVPRTGSRFKSILGANRVVRETGGFLVRMMALSLATPAAAAVDPPVREVLTSGPEPVNLVGLGLAVAVLFLFRRFSRTN